MDSPIHCSGSMVVLLFGMLSISGGVQKRTAGSTLCMTSLHAQAWVLLGFGGSLNSYADWPEVRECMHC